jgi:hypothetical protein
VPRRPDARDFEQLRLLESQLCHGIEVLQRTAAANAEMRASWRHTVRTRLQYPLRHGLVMLAMTLDPSQHDAFARQRIRHEYGLALDARHAARLVAQVGNIGFFRRNVDALHPGRLMLRIGPTPARSPAGAADPSRARRAHEIDFAIVFFVRQAAAQQLEAQVER